MSDSAAGASDSNVKGFLVRAMYGSGRIRYGIQTLDDSSDLLTDESARFSKGKACVQSKIIRSKLIKFSF